MKDWRLYYWIWLALASGITFILYGWDKFLSRRGGGRVPEAVFHGWALAGGFVGGWVGMSVFRHKTNKGFFVFVLAVSTAIHVVVYWGLGVGG